MFGEISPRRLVGSSARRLVGSIMVCLCATMMVFSSTSPALAAGVKYSQAKAPTSKCHLRVCLPPGKHYAIQLPSWLSLKLHRLLCSGVERGEKKGSHLIIHPYFVKKAFGCGSNPPPPSAYRLALSPEQSIVEPGDGNPHGTTIHANLNENDPHSAYSAPTDWTGTQYSSVDWSMYDLCGPGAVDVTLYYWPQPVQLIGQHSTKDLSDSVTTTWDDDRVRAYMLYLAWETKIPNEGPGIMDASHYPSGGTSIFGIRDALNWEASSESSNWQNYFYAVQPYNQSGISQTTLHFDIAGDTYYNNVAVVAEVNANMMPNWPPGGLTRHFISIIGYDDTADEYYYFDTCGAVTYVQSNGQYNYGTACGSNSNGGLQRVKQYILWNAISDVPVDSTDGGWVW